MSAASKRFSVLVDDVHIQLGRVHRVLINSIELHRKGEVDTAYLCDVAALAQPVIKEVAENLQELPYAQQWIEDEVRDVGATGK